MRLQRISSQAGWREYTTSHMVSWSKSEIIFFSRLYTQVNISIHSFFFVFLCANWKYQQQPSLSQPERGLYFSVQHSTYWKKWFGVKFQIKFCCWCSKFLKLSTISILLLLTVFWMPRRNHEDHLLDDKRYFILYLFTTAPTRFALLSGLVNAALMARLWGWW